MNDKDPTKSCLDYEQKYHKLFKDNCRLVAENVQLKKTIISMCKHLFQESEVQEDDNDD